MKNSSTIQQGVEVVRSFDALGRTENYALRAVDRNVKQALVDIVMSPLNAGEDPRTHRRTIHFVGSSWSYITDANGLLSTQNLGVVVVRGVSPDWKDGKVQDGREFVTQVRREGDFHVLSVILMRPFITNLVFRAFRNLKWRRDEGRNGNFWR